MSLKIKKKINNLNIPRISDQETKKCEGEIKD